VKLNVLLSIILFAAASMMLIIGVWCFQKKNVKGARTFALVVLAMTVHSAVYSIELLCSTVDQMFICIRLEYIGIAFYPYLQLLFTSEYTDEHTFANPVVRFLFLTFGFVTFFLVQTNPLHHLYYSSVSLGSPYGFPLLVLEFGPWYHVQSALLLCSALYGVSIFLFRSIRMDKETRSRSICLLLGIFVPCFSGLLYLLGVLPAHLDISTMSYFVLVIIYSIGLFRHSLFSIGELTHKMILDAIDEAVIVISPNNQIINCNDVAKRIPFSCQKLSIGDSLERCGELFAQLSSGHGGEFQLHDRYYLLKIIPYPKGHCTVLMINDATDSIRAKQDLERLATLDALTGCYNRRYVMQQGETELINSLRYDYPLSLIMIDIDFFKKINDTYGHHTGDKVLCALTGICGRTIRETDFLARYGGEEFLILLPHAGAEEAYAIAERLRANVEAHAECPFTISLGISSNQHDRGVSFYQLIAFADQAMYHSKHRGKNQTTLYGVKELEASSD